MGVDKLWTGWMAEHWGGLYRNIYPKICACVRVDLDGFTLLTFAIVFPVSGGFAEHNLFSQPVLIWFFKIMETGARLPKKERKDGRHELGRHGSRTDTAPGGWLWYYSKLHLYHRVQTGKYMYFLCISLRLRWREVFWLMKHDGSCRFTKLAAKFYCFRFRSRSGVVHFYRNNKF